MTRRDALSLIGGLTAAALVGGCSSADGGTTEDSGASQNIGTLTGPDSGTGTCTLYPQQTEGPYYLDLDLLRSDIAEGRPGTPLGLDIQVLSANGCAPLKDVAVDIWHCDAAGIYSGYPGQLGGLNTAGQNFLRGTQITDEDGRVHFDTIYPGWYPGRTTHIHFKVHRSSTSEATSQMYFPEELTAAIYQTPPYSARGQKDTSNARDSVARGSLPPLLAIAAKDNAYLAALTVTVAA
jgi:protocatechuate 3,4-dioxygenase beta subunit